MKNSTQYSSNNWFSKSLGQVLNASSRLYIGFFGLLMFLSKLLLIAYLISFPFFRDNVEGKIRLLSSQLFFSGIFRLTSKAAFKHTYIL